jgi:hypothetical protein
MGEASIINEKIHIGGCYLMIHEEEQTLDVLNTERGDLVLTTHRIRMVSRSMNQKHVASKCSMK